MQYGAILQDVAALHITIAKPRRVSGTSVSTQIAGLRRLLYGWESTETETGRYNLLCDVVSHAAPRIMVQESFGSEWDIFV